MNVRVATPVSFLFLKQVGVKDVSVNLTLPQSQVRSSFTLLRLNKLFTASDYRFMPKNGSGQSPGGHTNTNVVHIHDQRNTKKNCCFLRLKVILVNQDKGSKCAYFQDEGSFLDSIKERLGVIFQTPLFHQMCSPKYLVLG